MNNKNSIYTNDSYSISSPVSNSSGIKQFGQSCSSRSINDEQTYVKQNTFEVILSFLNSKGVKAGNPSSICEDFMTQKKESIKGTYSQGINMDSSSLLARRNRSLILH